MGRKCDPAFYKEASWLFLQELVRGLRAGNAWVPVKLASGCSEAAAQAPPGAGQSPGLLNSSSHRRLWVVSQGHLCPLCPVGACPHETLSTHLLLADMSQAPRRLAPLLGPAHCSTGDTFQLMTGAEP